ncbi:MAG: hypothetical protein DWQ31_05705 [Planctomycetota bacterium]|nr:MAG: hypothetical protein DWQ31_05705 [Planctomycetota bacterium]
MPLIIHFVEGARAGETLELDSDVDQIVIGRDASKCDVVFPPEETRVGREHCALRRVLGRYRFVLNGRNLVLVGGQPAIDDQELLNHTRVQLGPEGPVIQIEASLAPGYQATEMQQAIPTKGSVIAELQQTAQRSRRHTGITTAVIVLLALAAIGLWISSARHGAEVEEMRARIQLLDELSDEQKAAVQDVVAKYEQPDDDEQLNAALRAAERSVYLIAVQNERGGEAALGTAWVCDSDSGILATNAHVAEHFNSLDDGQRMIARNSAGHEVAVNSVAIHPGYRAFSNLWTEYAPGARTGPNSFKAIKAPGPGADVAILRLEATDDLAPALPLASLASLKKVDRLTMVGYVGYPMEGISLVNLKAPRPVSHAAYVIAATNFYGAADDEFADRQLIHHALPAAGGASGSPVIDSRGEVVAVLNAGTVIGFSGSGARITSGANINFAQRVDLVQELLDDTAKSAQAERTARWQRAIARDYERGRSLHRETNVRQTVDDWQDALSFFGDFEVTVSEAFSDVAIPPKGEGPRELSHTFATRPPHFGLVVASTELNQPAIDLQIRQGEDTVPGLVDRIRNRTTTDWLKFFAVAFGEEADYTAAVTSAGGDANLALQVFFAERRRRTPEERLAYGLDEVRDHYSNLRKYRIEAVPLVESERTLATPRDRVFSDSANVELPAKGDYFFVANSHEDQRIYLEVNAPGYDSLGSVNNGNSSLAYAARDYERPTDVVITVIGALENQKYDLRVYQIVEKK